MDQSIAEVRKQMLDLALTIEGRLDGLTEADLVKPAQWGGSERNVRFIMHRLTAHVLDHSLQIRKARLAIGDPASEAQGIVSQFMAAEAAMLGETVGLSAAQFEQPGGEGEWSVKQVLEHVVTTQKKFLEQLDQVLGPEAKK